MTGKLC